MRGIQSASLLVLGSAKFRRTVAPPFATARLAQSVEHETLNLRVVGSSPTLGAAFAPRALQLNKSDFRERQGPYKLILFPRGFFLSSKLLDQGDWNTESQQSISFHLRFTTCVLEYKAETVSFSTQNDPFLGS